MIFNLVDFEIVTKRIYFKEQLDIAKHNMKETWSILRTAMNKTKNKSEMPEYFCINNENVSDKRQIVNNFNKFFSTIGLDISNNVPTTQTSFTNFLPTPHNRSMFLDPITSSDVINIVSKLKNKTSRGYDNISTKLVKQSIQYIATPLTHIVNLSMNTGIVPSNMKIARVIPIFKSGNQHLFNNYRPISLLPAFSKVLEKIMANKLINYFESQKLVYKHQ